MPCSEHTVKTFKNQTGIREEQDEVTSKTVTHDHTLALVGLGELLGLVNES